MYIALQAGRLKVIKLGFIPLTDCAPLVIAKEMGFFQKYGLDVQVTKEASWANVRDKVLNGELDGAHCLFSMPFSVYEGIGGKAGSEMRIAMLLNNNGQAITLSKDFCGLVGFKELKKVAGAVKSVQAERSNVCPNLSLAATRYMVAHLAGGLRHKCQIGRHHNHSASANGSQLCGLIIWKVIVWVSPGMA